MEDPSRGETTGAARVIFSVDEGPRRTVDRISIHGNDRTAERVIKREITLEPGDPVSRNALLEIQRKLYSLGLFRSVDVKVEGAGADFPSLMKRLLALRARVAGQGDS